MDFFHKWYAENIWSVEELVLKYQIENTCMFYNSLASCPSEMIEKPH